MVETEATRSGLVSDVRPGVLVAGLSVVVLTVAVLQTAVVPVLGIIAHQLDASMVAVSWAVTANLLAAASILANAYIALGYGALPALVVAEVDAGETGVATSMNAIARTVGSSTAAALVAVLLGRTTAGVPMESSFVAIFIGGAATAALAMALIALSRPRAAAIESVEARYESRAMNHEWG